MDESEVLENLLLQEALGAEHMSPELVERYKPHMFFFTPYGPTNYIYVHDLGDQIRILDNVNTGWRYPTSQEEELHYHNLIQMENSARQAATPRHLASPLRQLPPRTRQSAQTASRILTRRPLTARSPGVTRSSTVARSPIATRSSTLARSSLAARSSVVAESPSGAGSQSLAQSSNRIPSNIRFYDDTPSSPQGRIVSRGRGIEISRDNDWGTATAPRDNREGEDDRYLNSLPFRASAARMVNRPYVRSPHVELPGGGGLLPEQLPRRNSNKVEVTIPDSAMTNRASGVRDFKERVEEQRELGARKWAERTLQAMRMRQNCAHRTVPDVLEAFWYGRVPAVESGPAEYDTDYYQEIVARTIHLPLAVVRTWSRERAKYYHDFLATGMDSAALCDYFSTYGNRRT